MTSLHFRDSDYRLKPGVWRGLIVTVGAATRAGFQIQVCDPMCIRVAAHSSPLLWARIDDDFWGYEILRPRRSESLNVVPPIPFAVVEHNSLPDPAESARAWARTFVEMLSESTTSPLSSGSWLLGRRGDAGSASELSSALVNEIACQRSHGYVKWDFGDEVYPFTLRDLSAADSGRVKAWRKHARAGTLPPVLLYWVSGLDAHVVLDGHDRLLAAALEGVSAPALSLEGLSEEGIERDPAIKAVILQQVSNALAAAEKERARPASERLARAQRLMDADHANYLLLDAFVPRHPTRLTRAQPLHGGSTQWITEVRSELDAQGITDSCLLKG